MQDYSYPSVYFAYFLFLLLAGGALYFFVRSFGDGYWGEKGEDVKYRMLNDEETEDGEHGTQRRTA